MAREQDEDEMNFQGPPDGFFSPNASRGAYNHYGGGNGSGGGGGDGGGGQSSTSSGRSEAAGFSDVQFDIFDWHVGYQNCQRYFLDHAQYEASVQAAAALMNIYLPHQWALSPIMNSGGTPPTPVPSTYPPSTYPPSSYPPSSYPPPPHWAQPASMAGDSRRAPGSHGVGAAPAPAPAGRAVLLVPFVRRLVVTGFDRDGVLHGFFGDEWRKGIGPVQECERRNFLFAAKSVGWAKVKYQYDILPYETVPFLRPLQHVHVAEIEAAEKCWSEWLAMEDWMVGPRAPDAARHSAAAAAAAAAHAHTHAHHQPRPDGHRSDPHIEGNRPTY